MQPAGYNNLFTHCRDLGCALVQGYYFSRPLHPADFEATFLKNA